MTEVIETHELTQEFAANLLAPYIEAREQEAIYGKQKTRLGDLLKHYLEQHAGEVVWDGERRIEGRLQERHGTDGFEMERMPDDLVLLLNRIGALSVNAAVIKACTVQEVLDRIKPYKVPGKTTTALQVEVK